MFSDGFLRSPPAHKRQKSSTASTSPARNATQVSSIQVPGPTESTASPALLSASAPNPRKRRVSQTAAADPAASLVGASTTEPVNPESATSASLLAATTEEAVKKKGRTNTPWTAAEEQRLKAMRDAGNSWGEIAKVR